MKVSDFYEDVVSLTQRREQKAQQGDKNRDAMADKIIDNLDHALAKAMDEMANVLGDEIKAHEMIINHLKVMYDDEIQH